MRSRLLTLAAGTALILIANAVALLGVLYNRSGEPESRLNLSQRELGRPWKWEGNKENSGLSLTLEWRVPNTDAERHYLGNHGGSPAWLDEKRMSELGFDVQSAKGDDTRREKHIWQSEREVLVVLELAGAAWQQALEQARQRLAHQESLRRAKPDAKELIAAENRAREDLAQEEKQNSRLFAVDVGFDSPTLRAKYPDRGRYLILKGKLRLYTKSFDKKPVLGGYLDDLGVRQINVPHALRGVFENAPSKTGSAADKKLYFTATVAIGKRLEPWIEALTTP